MRHTLPQWTWLASFAAFAACSESPPSTVTDAGTDAGMDGAVSACSQAQATLSACELDFPGSISDPAVIAACTNDGLLSFVSCVNMFPVEACSDEPTNAFTDCLFGP